VIPAPRPWLTAGSLLLLAAGSLALCSHSVPPPEHSLEPARRASFEVRVETVGTLDAARAFHVVSGLRGDRGRIAQISEDGAQVEKGDVVVRFDATPFEADLLRLGGELRSREAMVEFARQNLEMEKSQVHKTLDNGEFDRRNTQQEDDRYRAYIDDLEALQRKGYAMGSEIAQARRKEEQLLTLMHKSESELGRLQREAVHKVAQAAAELDKAESEAATSRAALAAVREEIARAEVRAPSAGFVVLHERFDGSVKRRVRPGDTVWQGQPVLYIPDLSAMVVKTQVREEDLHKLRPGQAATVRFDAYPDARMEAEVASIGALAVEDTALAKAGKHFQLTVNMHGADPRLRPGMTARVTIVADRARDALVIPIAALHYQGGDPVCYVFDGQELAARRVTVGRRGDELVEVVAGLTAGERVSLASP
jgi:HlyD family secretion protein